MELKTFTKEIKKNWKLIAATIIVIVAVVTLFNVMPQQKYEVNFSLLISQTQTQKTQDFKYDSYYALKAKDKIADYIVAVLKSPEEVVKILKDAHVPTQILSTYELRTFLKPYKASSQNIGITFYVKNPRLSQQITKSILYAANQSLSATYHPYAQDAKFHIEATSPLVSLKKPRLTLIFFTSFFFGLVLGCIIVLGKSYFASQVSSKK